MNPLDQLNDIITPQASSWWPLSPAAWIVLVLLFSLMLLLFVYLRRNGIANLFRSQGNKSAYRKAALRELQQIDPQADPDSAQKILKLLKRCSLHLPEPNLASLPVSTFLRQLNHYSKQQCFADDMINQLKTSLYMPGKPGNCDAFLAASRLWVTRHRRVPHE